MKASLQKATALLPRNLAVEGCRAITPSSRKRPLWGASQMELANTQNISPQNMPNPDINWHVCDKVRAQNIPVSGPMLKVQVLKASIKFKDDFMASNEWLDAFVSQHKIKLANLHGESVGGSLEANAHWKSQLPSICERHSLKDITTVTRPSFSSRPFPWEVLYGKISLGLELRCWKNALQSCSPAVPLAERRIYCSWIKPSSCIASQDMHLTYKL